METNEKREMLDFYYGKNIMLHVKLSNGRFYNGFFLGWEDDGVLTFDDRVIGCMRIFLSQIVEIEEFRGSKE